jgi:hypothetical protein
MLRLATGQLRRKKKWTLFELESASGIGTGADHEGRNIGAVPAAHRQMAIMTPSFIPAP